MKSTCLTDYLAVLATPEYGTRLIDGEPSEWDRLSRLLETRFFRMAYSALHNTEIAEEVVQEVFMKAWAKRSQCTPDGFRSWIYTILRYTIITVGERHGRRVDSVTVTDVFEGGIQPEAVAEIIEDKKAKLPCDAASQREVRTQFRECFKSLSPEQQEAIQMFHFDEVGTIEECAELLGIPCDTFKSRVYYGRKKLKEGLEGKGFSH